MMRRHGGGAAAVVRVLATPRPCQRGAWPTARDARVASVDVAAPPLLAFALVQRATYGHRQGQFQVGDWKCKTCSSHNFARNSRCYSCGATMPNDPNIRALQVNGGKQQVAKGQIRGAGNATVASTKAAYSGLDWWCPRCRSRNKDASKTCFTCRTPKPTDEQRWGKQNPEDSKPLRMPRT